MREPTDKCLLCGENNSDKKNSHLIPKFFGNGIFEGTNPRHGIQISRNGKTSKIQDIFKEDYILCSNCEKGLGVLETYCYLRLERFDDLQYRNQFSTFKRGEFQYFECTELNNKIFNLFIYSIVWRLSISQHFAFENLKLSTQDEEKLRIALNNCISSTQSGLFENLDKFNNIIDHSHVIIRPTKKLRPPTSHLSAASIDDTIHQIFLVDYIVFYLTDKKKLFSAFVEIDNNSDIRNTRIGLIRPEKWENYNIEILNKLI